MMSLSRTGILTNEPKLNIPNKRTTLNPNAAEFIPHALRSSSESTGTDLTARVDASETSGKEVLNRSSSSISNKSENEAHEYWHNQLPDDITPDFKLMGENEPQGPESLSFASLSIHDGSEASRFSASANGVQILTKQQELSSHVVDDNSLVDKMRYSISLYGEDRSFGSPNLPTNPWDKQLTNGDKSLSYKREGLAYSGNYRSGFRNDFLSKHTVVDGADIDQVKFLASRFPRFTAESLAEVYFANGCNFNLTIEMLNQLELQVDGGFNQNLNSKTLSAQDLNIRDSPALPVLDGQNGLPKHAIDSLKQNSNPYQPDMDNLLMFKSSFSASARGTTESAAAVKKLASQHSGQWTYDRNGVANASVGSSRSSHILPSSYGSGHGISIYGDRLQNHGSARAAPIWLQNGEALANMYSELGEEAQDHASLRNACFEQARQAYLIGNKTLAKELSMKGQLHDMRIKAAHGKAQDSIYRQRNLVAPELQGFARGEEERMIDLNGLHVSEAILVLKQELSILRNKARSAEHQLQLYICIGTNHHTKGSRVPSRLPLAVARYLLEEEGLDYTETQPGLLRVVLY